MSSVAPALTAPPSALPWYRVIAPFSWFTEPKKPPRLRPAGHFAWVEAVHQPALFFISLAFMMAGLYTLAKDYVVKALSAIGSGDYTQIIPVSIALFVIVVTGAAIEIAFLTAASRFRMHLLRGRSDIGWTVVSAVMLLFTLSVELLTCSYMFYQIERPTLTPQLAAFMENVPILLFFVRAGAALICAAYLIIGVLPFVIRVDDVRREMAAEAGAAKVAIIQRLLRIINNLSVWQMLAIYEPVAAIFRDNAGYTSNQMTHRLVLDALADVRSQLTSTITARATALGVAADQFTGAVAHVFDPVERAFHERGTGAELERYDEQTHAALTRLQERLQEATAIQVNQQGTDIPADQFQQLVADLAALRDQVAEMPATTDASPDMEYQIKAWAERLAQQFSEKIAAVQEQFAAMLADRDEAPVVSNSAPPAGSVNPVQPKPGTKKFNQLVSETAQRLLMDGQMTIFNIAQALKVDPQVIQDAIAALKQERLRKLKPGKDLDPDPVLDTL